MRSGEMMPNERPDSGGHEPADCPRCGALLPEGDEGLCAVCGKAFGRTTATMPRVDMELLSQHGYASTDVQTVHHEADQPPPSTAQAKLALALVGTVVLVLALILVLFLLLRD